VGRALERTSATRAREARLRKAHGAPLASELSPRKEPSRRSQRAGEVAGEAVNELALRERSERMPGRFSRGAPAVAHEGRAIADPLTTLLHRLVKPPRPRALGESAGELRDRPAAPSEPLVPMRTLEAWDRRPSRAKTSAQSAAPEAARAARPGAELEAASSPVRGIRGRIRAAREAGQEEALTARLTPVPGPVPDFPLQRAAETTVQIHIGHVEVHARVAGPEVPSPRRPQPALMSLDEYLAQRSARNG
jgi:hypothetical protein